MGSSINASPINYKIHLEPDLERFQFSGTTEILIETTRPVGEISLNILDLAIWSCKIVQEEEDRNCPFSVDPSTEALTIALPNALSGKIVLKIDYTGKINDSMAGFYRSKYVIDGMEKVMAVTQFEESDARRAFPCFDHPVKKATFDVEIVIDDRLTAISNSSIDEQKPVDGNRLFIRFQQTPIMSTYLLFFGVGEFEFIEDPGEILVRVATRPGLKKYGTLGLEFGRKSLEYSEAYYGIRYPLPKLDLIAVADFAFGAMENWGAITFRENLLLRFPNITSRGGEARICEVIAHEIAHQWFGNLVTPSDWKYLWLNESFATYFGYGVVDHYEPDWGVWEQFLHGETESAMERDSLRETFPIEIPGGEHVVISASTAPIIYNKGGSILRQIEGYVGKENFQQGIRRFLKNHEYSCAASHHLWQAFEEASEKPISEMMSSWIGQPGFPIIEVKREGERLSLEQGRFTYLPFDWDQEWRIPVAVKVFYKNGHTELFTTLMDAARTDIRIGPDAVAYKVNDGQNGFYRVKYLEKKNLKQLAKRVADKSLPPEDRWGIQADYFALFKRGDVSLDDYLHFLSNYSEEDAFLPLISIAANLFHAYRVLEGSVRKKLASTGKNLFETVLRRIGHEPESTEKHTVSILREPLIWHAVLYGSEEVSQWMSDKFSSLTKGGGVHPDLMKCTMQVGALNGDDEVFAWFERRLKTSGSEHERMNIQAALGCFSAMPLIEKAQRYIMTKVPDRNKFIPIGSLAANPFAVPHLWQWYLDHLAEFERFHPIHYERVIAAVVPVGGLGKEEEVRRFFEDYMVSKVEAKDVINMSLERLEVNARMRARQ